MCALFLYIWGNLKEIDPYDNKRTQSQITRVVNNQILPLPL